MNRDDKNFLELKQADAKLELALQRYQQPDVEADMRTEYLRYLRLRIRPAMDRLIREGNVRALQELIGQIPPDESSLKMAMQAAGDSGQGECFAWLWNYRRKGSGCIWYGTGRRGSGFSDSRSAIGIGRTRISGIFGK